MFSKSWVSVDYSHQLLNKVSLYFLIFVMFAACFLLHVFKFFFEHFSSFFSVFSFFYQLIRSSNIVGLYYNFILSKLL